MSYTSSLIPSFGEFVDQLNQYNPHNLFYSGTPFNMEYNFSNSPTNLFTNPLFRSSAPPTGDFQMRNTDETEEGEINESEPQTATPLTPEKLKLIHNVLEKFRKEDTPHITTNPVSNPNKSSSEIRANELRAKLLAMKGCTLHTSKMPTDLARSSVTVTQPVSKNSDGVNSLHAMIAKGNAAIAEEEAEKSEDKRKPSTSTNVSTTKSSTSIKDNNINANPSPSVRLDKTLKAVDEAAQYQKLRELSARFETLNSSSKPVIPRPGSDQLEKYSEVSKNDSDGDRDTNQIFALEPVAQRQMFIQTSQRDTRENKDANQEGNPAKETTVVTTTHANSQSGKETVMQDSDQIQEVESAQYQSYYDDVEAWLELTGYHDVEYRKRAINRVKKQKALRAQLAELDREAQLEGFRARPSISEDIKPAITMSKALPPLELDKADELSTASKAVTTDPRKKTKQYDDQSRKRSLSPETYSTTTPHFFKSSKGERRNNIQNGGYKRNTSTSFEASRHVNPAYHNHSTTETLTSPFEPLERRVSGYDGSEGQRYDSYAARRGRSNNVQHNRHTRRGGKR